MNSVRLPKAAYIQLYESSENGKINWATHIKNLLFRYGFGIVFFYQDVGDESLFVSQFKQTVIDCYKQDWNALMNDSPKMCSYKEYKVDFICEKYLDVLNIRKYRIAFTKLRLGCHFLNIELGRHQCIAREHRICFIVKIHVKLM